jgi:hypothetical protein
MRRDYCDYEYDNSVSGTTVIIIFIVIVLFFFSACSDGFNVSNERRDAGMVYIKEGYCYDGNTKIIYRESIVDGGRYGYDTPTYSPYINENGNYCKYKNGQWIEFTDD